MNFKHGKFDDSAVLRSLEKVALEKGLVKPEKITKSASQLVSERDLEPTGNLSQDIVKLCAGLRKEGLHKHADEIESNFINYKKAQTLYETSKETGEDLVHAAHPDGPFVFKDVEGKPEVLDIITKHMNIIKTVNKQPTGKLAYRRNLNALKKALAHDENPQDLMAQSRDKISDAKNVYNQLCQYTDPLLYYNIERADGLSFDACSSTPSTFNIAKLQSEIKAVEKNAAPATSWYQFGHGVPADKWAAAKKLFDDIYDLIGDQDKNQDVSTYDDTAYALSFAAERLSKSLKRKKPGTSPTPAPTDGSEPSGTGSGKPGGATSVIDEQFKTVDAQISKMKAYKRTGKVRSNSNAVKIADQIISKFEEIKEFYSGVEDPDAILDQLKEEVQTGVNTVQEYYNKYVK